MNATELKSRPLWLESTRPRFESLTADAEFDVVVIGGGITGLTAAWLLKRAGKRVALFEKGRIGGAETGHTTAHLTFVADTQLSRLSDTFGEEAAAAAWRGGQRAIDTIEAIARELDIRCNFHRVPGFLHSALTKDRDERDELRAEARLAARLGFEAHYVDRAPLVGRPGIRFSDQACFHPVEYLAGLARAVHGDGSVIHEQSEIAETSDDPLRVVIRGHTVRCRRLLIATHVPLVGTSNLVSATLLQSKLAAYSTYAIGATAPPGRFPHASFWDTDDPYYYLRIDSRNGRDSLIFGGEDHKSGQHNDPEERYARLESRLLELVPEAEVDHRWSGQVIETNDGLPYIGPANDTQFVATGFAGNGMTFGTLAALMACDWVLGGGNPWQGLFRIDRTKIRGGTWDYLRENIDYPWQLVKGFLTRSEGSDLDDVPQGEGRILRLDGRRCAAYRSRDNTLQVCSAICPHMGCVVRWNAAEQTWDCPCHGSRFGTDGHVVAGPAESPLDEVPPAEK